MGEDKLKIDWKSTEEFDSPSEPQFIKKDLKYRE